MSPKEKAQDIVGGFREKVLTQHSAWNVMVENSFPMPLKFAQKIAIQCAILSVDMLIESSGMQNSSSYWRLVKKEISNI